MGKDQENEQEKVIELGSEEPAVVPTDTFEPMEATTPEPQSTTVEPSSPETDERIEAVEAENDLPSEPAPAETPIPVEPAPVAAATVAPVAQPAAISEKKPSKAWLGWTVATLLILGLACTSGWLYSRYQFSENSLNDTKSQLAKTESELVSAKATAEAAKAENVISTTAVVQSDDDMIIDATKAWEQSRKGSEKVAFTITVVKKQLPFARVSVGVKDETGGHMCVLKKTNNIWLVLFCGQAAPEQDVLDEWGVPSSILTS